LNKFYLDVLASKKTKRSTKNHSTLLDKDFMVDSNRSDDSADKKPNTANKNQSSTLKDYLDEHLNITHDSDATDQKSQKLVHNNKKQNEKNKVVAKQTKNVKSLKKPELIDLSKDEGTSIPVFIDYSSYNFIQFFGLNSVREFDTRRHEELLLTFCDRYKKMQSNHIIYKELRFGNFLTLKPKGWLDDNIINSYFDYLNSLENNTTFFVHPFFFGMVNFESIIQFNEKSDNLKEKKEFFKAKYDQYCKKYFYHQGNNIIKYERVCFAVHKKPNHWVSIVVERNGAASNITYYDSIFVKKDIFADAAVDFVEMMMNQLEIDAEIETTEFLTERCTNFPQQEGFVDCGIFVCMLANDFFNYSTIKDTCKENVAYFRLYLLFLFIEKAGKQIKINQAITAVTDRKVDFDKNLKQKTDNKFYDKIEEYDMLLIEGYDTIEDKNYGLKESVKSFIRAVRISDDIMDMAGNNLQRGVIQYLKDNLKVEAVEEVGFIEHFSSICIKINEQIDQIINDAKDEEYELFKLNEKQIHSNEIINSNWRSPLLLENNIDTASTQVSSSPILKSKGDLSEFKKVMEKKDKILNVKYLELFLWFVMVWLILVRHYLLSRKKKKKF